MVRFFVSYTSVDNAYADWVIALLREAGYTATSQSWNCWSEDDCALAAAQEMTDIDIAILVLSEDYLQSAFRTPQWAEVFFTPPAPQKHKLLPIKIRGCEPDKLLNAINCTDLVGLQPDTARQTILDIAQKQYLSSSQLIQTSKSDTVATSRSVDTEYLLQKRLATDRQLSENNTNIATSLYKLACCYSYDNEDSQRDIESLLKEALAINRHVLGNNHQNVVNSLYHLADIYEHQGRYGEMSSLYQEAVNINKQLHGNIHLDVAASLITLGDHYNQEDDYINAETCFLEALAIKAEIWGNQHLDSVDTLNNLAWLYLEQKRYDEAEARFLESLSINRQWWGEVHDNFVGSLENLATLYGCQNRNDEAECLLLKALKTSLNDDFRADSIRRQLAYIYDQQGHYNKAEEFHLENLECTRRRLGEEHQSLASELNQLARFYRKQQQYKKAEILYNKIFYIAKKTLPKNHVNHGIFLFEFGLLLAAQGNVKQARENCQKALDLILPVFGEDNPWVLNYQKHLDELEKN